MKYCIGITLAFLPFFLLAQATKPFQKEVNEIVERNDSLWNPSKKTIVFTGSSSIRFWKNLQDKFPTKQVLNAGFGGSQTTDLLQHLDELVLRYKPHKVFIYEGDNDIFSKKRPKAILATTHMVVDVLLKDDTNREIVLISAKPSLARWRLRGRYKRLNRLLAKYAFENPKVTFVDVWNPMLLNRKVRPDIFVEDGLHMNSEGYEIWYSTLKDFVN